MKALLLAGPLLCFASMVMAQPRLLVATDLWPPNFTLRSGDGLYQQILQQVYPEHRIAYVYTSYARSKNMVLSKKADLWLASYKHEVPDALYPSLPYDADILTLVRKHSTQWQSMADLNNTQVGWIQAYELDQYLPESGLQIYEVPSIEDGIRMLLAGRITFYLDDSWNVRDYLHQHPELTHQLASNNLALLPLYPGFANTAQGKQLSAHWDQALKELYRSGALQAIYARFENDYVAASCHADSAPPAASQWAHLPCLTRYPAPSYDTQASASHRP
ncbi:transporter substrate-binding domain-containing protein [Lacimicrobium sp. SS2-24]|uniref:substrate-binding periplasmic protein n=1 Tax=Lacimicrobium sp. SS2-24 TaxID=2005569 RepID=UPI001130B9E8|nr:transporter substrate-binding domain-containing protein [Lacimicrobium sp. SS2-24]